jgi:plastocyanin
MRSALTICFLFGLALLVACSSSAAPAAQNNAAPAAAPAAAQEPSTHVIEINNFKFQPADLTIKLGDTVEWQNKDTVAHNAAASDKTFATQKLATGASEKWVSNKKGRFPYICTLHPNMRATLTVE